MHPAKGHMGLRIRNFENSAQSEVANQVAKSSQLRKFRDVSRNFGDQIIWHFFWF